MASMMLTDHLADQSRPRLTIRRSDATPARIMLTLEAAGDEAFAGMPDDLDAVQAIIDDLQQQLDGLRSDRQAAA